ncbi:hypothetical protein HYT59_01035 [Candidatus Woesebacteria bacterium]|nr:hypothetical protein [Candidatus Woesebacteria bacterium]
MVDRDQCISELDPSWFNLITNNPTNLYRDGGYRGICLEIGPGETPVSWSIARDNPDIFVLNIEKEALWLSSIHDIAKHTLLRLLPKNWRYFNGPICDLKLDMDIPTLGVYSFFPSQNGFYGREVARFVSQTKCPTLIVTESRFNGSWGTFLENFDDESKKLSMVSWLSIDQISFAAYEKAFPQTLYSRKLLTSTQVNMRPSHFLVVEVTPPHIGESIRKLISRSNP